MTRQERLQSEKNIWLASTRPDGHPHLVPIWFVWVEECFYICTEKKSVKARNLQHNPNAMVALESGAQPVVAECQAEWIDQPYPHSIIEAFYKKYEWNIVADQQYNILIALHPKRWLMVNSESNG